MDAKNDSGEEPSNVSEEESNAKPSKDTGDVLTGLRDRISNILSRLETHAEANETPIPELALVEQPPKKESPPAHQLSVEKILERRRKRLEKSNPEPISVKLSVSEKKEEEEESEEKFLERIRMLEAEHARALHQLQQKHRSAQADEHQEAVVEQHHASVSSMSPVTLSSAMDRSWKLRFPLFIGGDPSLASAMNGLLEPLLLESQRLTSTLLKGAKFLCFSDSLLFAEQLLEPLICCLSVSPDLRMLWVLPTNAAKDWKVQLPLSDLLRVRVGAISAGLVHRIVGTYEEESGGAITALMARVVSLWFKDG